MKGRKSIGEARATLSVSVLPKFSSEEVLDKHNRFNNMYILLTKREVKMAGYWPSSLFAFFQYPVILTELAWSIKDLLYGIKSSEKNYFRTWLFSSTEKETS